MYNTIYTIVKHTCSTNCWTIFIDTRFFSNYHVFLLKINISLSFFAATVFVVKYVFDPDTFFNLI